MARRTFDTYLLDEAIAGRAKALETERREILQKVVAALRSRAPHLGLREAYVVGSLAKEGEWTDGSDVDVAIAGGDPLAIMMFLEDATELPVDVIDLERHPTPDSFRRKGIKVVG
jgi:predicted nucleotidyltransferase